MDGLTDKRTRARVSFSAEDRVKERRDFQRFLSARCKSGDRSLIVLAYRNGLKQARLGIAVPKKQVRLAVKRNRLKRRVREFFRHYKSKLAGFDALVIVLKPACELTGLQFHDLLHFHCTRISRCKES
ncbi:MAG: ribonuclease P protein component [Gammaproteobacteria bacterium]